MKNNICRRTSSALIFFILITSTAHADKPSETPASAPAKKVTSTTAKTKKVQVTFSDELVDGSTVKPDVDSINVKKDFNYKKLIRVRENFLNEMEDGLNDFKGH